jgi:hypothetical protein
MSSSFGVPQWGILCPVDAIRAFSRAFCYLILILPSLGGAESQVLDKEAAADAQLQADIQLQAAASLQWNSLTSDLTPSNVTLAIMPATYVSSANKYKDFYTKYSTSAQSGQAKCSEALLLLTARRYGDNTVSDRCALLVEAIKKDKSITELQRYKVVAVSEQIDGGVSKLRGAEKMAALAAVHKKLIAAFPSLQDSYEALLATAERADPSIGTQLAGELQTMKLAPEGVRARAKILQSRNTLLGKSFIDLASPVVGSFAGISTQKGRPVFIYSWSVSDSFSVEIGKAVAASAPPGAVVIALNTDLNQSQAMAFAAKERLPGYIYCDGKGGFSPFATILELRRAGIVYATNEKGIITSVQKQWDPTIQALAIKNSSTSARR